MGFDDNLRALGIFKCWIEIMTEGNKFFLEKYKAKPIAEMFDSQGFIYIYCIWIILIYVLSDK